MRAGRTALQEGPMHDLVIRGATIVDGTGAPAFPGDVAVDEGRITGIGHVDDDGREGIEAGALGVSTSRTIAHRAIDGEPVPGTFAAEDELFGLGRALAQAGAGVFELAPAGVMGEDLAAPEREVDWMRRLARETK